MDNIEVRKAIEFIVNENGGMSGASRKIYVFGNIDDLDLSRNLIRVKTVCNNEAYINLRYVSMITQVDIIDYTWERSGKHSFFTKGRKSIDDFKYWLKRSDYTNHDFKMIDF